MLGLAMRGIAVIAALLYVATIGAKEAAAGPEDTAPAIAPARVLDLPGPRSPVEVSAGFHLTTVHRIDDNAETFEFSGVLTLAWDDARQAFDPAAEGVGEKVFNGAFQFNRVSPSWYPQVILENATLVDTSRGILLRVAPDGRSTLTQPVHGIVRSRFDLLSYPFDSQRLEAVFRVLGFDEGEVVLRPAAGAEALEATSLRLPQWDLVGIEVTPRSVPLVELGAPTRSSALVVSVDVKRRSFFMVRLVLVPLALIVVLSWCVFWMDPASLGERMSVSFVGILTAVSYQVLVSGSMPRIAYVTFVNAFLSFSFLVMCLTALVNVLAARLYRQGQTERSHRLDRLCRWLFPLVFAALVGFAAAYAAL